MNNSAAPFPWQADLYHCPGGEWLLLICTATGDILREVQVANRELNPHWLQTQLSHLPSPTAPLRVFRPDCLPWFTQACQALNLTLVPSRHTPALKRLLTQRFGLEAVTLFQPPPQPLPETLMGEQWRFLTIAAQDLSLAFGDRPSRYRLVPPDLMPLEQGLAADCPIPGVVIYGGRRSRQLGQWLAEQHPMALTYQANDPGRSGGLVLNTSLVDRWIMATFEDEEMAIAAAVFQKRQQQAKGLHFLWLQPDSSGLTSTGIWLLWAG